ncbi:MAG: glucose 1-dehydrogenase [Spirochaetota bacterium]
MSFAHLQEKVSIVTGATSGLGKNLAETLASHGSHVVICGRREKEGKATEESIRSQGGECAFVTCDVGEGKDVEKLVKFTLEKYGRLDYAVNNAAILEEQTSFLDFSEKSLDNIIRVNLKGMWLCMKEQIPEISKTGGAIVNIASVAGLIGGYRGITPYSTTKHGVLGLTKSVALEFANQGVRINAVCPGSIDDTAMLETVLNAAKDPDAARENMPGMYPIKRLSKPSEVSDVVLWLLSPQASYMIGAAIPIDGGWTAK